MKTQKESIFKMDVMNHHLFERRQSRRSEGLTAMSALHSVTTYYLLCGKSLAKCHELS